MEQTACAFIFYKDKLLLINHKKTKKIFPVGGHSEPYETPKDTVIREVKEEVNLDIEFLEYYNFFKEVPNIIEIHPKPFYIFAKPNRINYDFLCRTYDISNLKILESELDGYKWYSEKDLEELTEPMKTLAKEAFKQIK